MQFIKVQNNGFSNFESTKTIIASSEDYDRNIIDSNFCFLLTTVFEELTQEPNSTQSIFVLLENTVQKGLIMENRLCKVLLLNKVQDGVDELSIV